MDKPTLEMSVSKYSGVSSLINLAWLDEFQNPSEFYSEFAEFIDPQIRLVRDILNESDELHRNKENTPAWALSKQKLKLLLKTFTANEVLPYSVEHYYEEEFWAAAGPLLAQRLAFTEIYRIDGVKVPRVRVKDLHARRARCFELVKHAARVLEDAFLDVERDYKTLPSKLLIDYSDNYDVLINLDTENPIKSFNEKHRMPSDREIFKVSKLMFKHPKFHVVNFVDELIEFSGISNFKSMERSLSKGRRALYG